MRCLGLAGFKSMANAFLLASVARSIFVFYYFPFHFFLCIGWYCEGIFLPYRNIGSRYVGNYIDTNIVIKMSKFLYTELCHRDRNPDDITELQEDINIPA